ncbi:hypothetical protein ACV8S3_22900 [Citrobacter freundii]
MKKYLPAVMLVGLVASFPGWAINVGEITSIMTSAESSLSKEITKEGANKQVISSQADSLIKISRIWADFFPANTSNQPI